MILRTGIFYLLTFFFTFLIGGLLQFAGAPAELGVPQFGPALAALAMLLIFRKDVLKLNLSFQGVDRGVILMTVLVPLSAAAVIFMLVMLLVGGNTLPPPVTAVMLVWMPFGAFGEEVGWRGYLHRMLDGRSAGWLSTLIVGTLWALWHVQLYQNGVVYMLFLVVLMVSYSTILYAVMKKTDFNVWIAALFHLLINTTNLLYFSVIEETPFMIVSALVWAVIAGVIVARSREMFFYTTHPA